jgi:lipoprotein NlpI
MLPRPTAIAIALFAAVLAGAAAAEDMDDCKQGAATFALKGCTSWLAREKEPDARAIAFHRRGVVFEIVGEYNRSLLDLNQAIELNPSNAGWYVDRALLYFLKEDFGAALANANRAVAMEPSRAAYQARGFIHYYSRDFANAAADLAHVLEMQPDDPNSAIHRYLAKARLGEDALPELRANAERLTDRGFRFAAVGLYLGTVAPDALIGQDDPGAGCQPRYYIGALSLLQNKPDEAASSFQQAAGLCGEASGRWWWVAARAELKGLGR